MTKLIVIELLFFTNNQPLPNRGWFGRCMREIHVLYSYIMVSSYVVLPLGQTGIVPLISPFRPLKKITPDSRVV